MNENLNLLEILKDCPKGTKLYSTIHGEVEFDGIGNSGAYRVEFKTENEGFACVTSDGRHLNFLGGECILFPSKDQRDWSKFIAPWLKKERFDTKTLKPFDKVLVRDENTARWKCAFYSHERGEAIWKYATTDSAYIYCIPYNDDTRHLVGTNEEAPEFYRYWEYLL